MTHPALSRRRRWVIGLTVAITIAVAAVSGFAAALHAGSTRASGSATAAFETATVQRTTLASRRSVTGSLGYEGTSTIASANSGILTSADGIGSIVTRGHPLFSVDGIASYLLYGSVPAWRDYTTWAAPGADIAELSTNLAEMGYLAPSERSDHAGWPITNAVEHWQHRLGLPLTGQLSFGQIVFAASPLRVTGISTAVGTSVTAGSALISATSTALGVTAAIDPTTAASLRVGNQVTVSTPDGQQRPATIASIATVATLTPSSTGGQPTVTVPVTIAFTPAWSPRGSAVDQAPVSIAITVRRATDVLAVPVTALLASPSGYVVELATPLHPSVAVTPGLFDDLSGLVEVTGALQPGQKVVVAAS
jgi:hypothetical protein